jgi:Spherulation-specific family 4
MMRLTAIASAAAGTLVLVLVLASRAAERRPACPEGLVPAYLPPRAMIELARSPQLPRLLVINPASGPGTAPVPLFHDAVRAAQRAGARVLGYVHTGWGARDAGEVDADVDRYVQWYGVDGVFFDEAAHDPGYAAHYKSLAAHARGAGAKTVALNPGVVPARGYFSFADVVVTFEGTYAEYEARHAAYPAWLAELPPERTAQLVYGASREQALELARTATGRLYATSGEPPDPWGTLPDYLSDEQAARGGCP